MIDWRTVPAGPFAMGSDVAAAYPPDEDETPRRVVSLAPFRIARTPVTNRQYARFVEDTGRAWPAPGHDDVPVTYVTWKDAAAFCTWAGARLPTEQEWEHAARGLDDRLWPWGDDPPDRSRAVFAGGIGSPRPVGSVPDGASPYGVRDLAGNVCEWTDGFYGAGSERSVRGGSFVDPAGDIRCSARRPVLGAARDHYIGFRPVAAPGAGRDELDWVHVPGGEAPVGRDYVAFRGEALADELPRHVLDVPAYALSATQVTNAQYSAFVTAAAGAPPPHWPDGRLPDELAEHPVTWVDWHDADAFCRWAGGRLPTEPEWEKAARGTEGRTYPWGDEPDELRAIVGRGSKHGKPERVGSLPEGASPYGLLDMAGNVWEWTATWYGPTRPHPRTARNGSCAAGRMRAPTSAWPAARREAVATRPVARHTSASGSRDEGGQHARSG